MTSGHGSSASPRGSSWARGQSAAGVDGELPSSIRARLAAAHELGHYLIADEYAMDWRVALAEAQGREARLDRFARALLLPEPDLRERWATWPAIPDESWRDAAVRAASHYGVDMTTLARRLVELGLADRGQADDVHRVKTKRADIVEKDLVVRDEMPPVTLPRPYEQAVLKLYRREVISTDRALGLLRGTFDEEALPDLPKVPEAEIWEVTSWTEVATAYVLAIHR